VPVSARSPARLLSHRLPLFSLVDSPPAAVAEEVLLRLGNCPCTPPAVVVISAANISNDPNFRLKHTGVPDGSDASDGTSYALTENYIRPVATATGRLAYVPPVLCGDVYTSSERHVCYTLPRGRSYAEAICSMPGDRPQAWEHLGPPANNLGAPATCLGAPRITVKYSVCILIYVSMYLYSYRSTHAISGLAAVS